MINFKNIWLHAYGSLSYLSFGINTFWLFWAIFFYIRWPLLIRKAITLFVELNSICLFFTSCTWTFWSFKIHSYTDHLYLLKCHEYGSEWTCVQINKMIDNLLSKNFDTRLTCTHDRCPQLWRGRRVLRLGVDLPPWYTRSPARPDSHLSRGQPAVSLR